MEWFASMLKAQADFTEGFAKMVGGAPFGQQSQGEFSILIVPRTVHRPDLL